MKRAAFFLLWTVVFWMFALMLGGQVARMTHSIMHLETREPKGVREGFQVGWRTGMESSQASFAFMRRYWHVTLGGAGLVAAVGSLSGVLPGTGRPKITEPPPLPGC